MSGRSIVRGFSLTGIGLSCLVFGFEIVGRGGLPVSVVVAMIARRRRLHLTALCPARQAHAVPVIDLRLLEMPTFRIGVTGGTLFRMGIGALPFLLPLMLQLGFGYSPLASGLLTFASAAGAMTMTASAATVIRRFGFRNMLIFNAFLTRRCFGVNALCRRRRRRSR